MPSVSLPSAATALITRLESGAAHIGVIGLGYVGLPLALAYAEAGCRVTGFDIDPAKIDAIAAGKSYIRHIEETRLTRATAAGFCATQDFSTAAQMDALILCLPTPLNRTREPDLSYVFDTMDTLRPYLKRGQVVSLESTTYPGTTDEALKSCLERDGRIVGEDIFLVYSPERENPGNPDFTTRTIPKLCSGITPACLAVGEALYARVVDTVVPVRSTRVAEMAKLLENIHRAVNIGLVNEMKLLAERMGIDIYDVIDAAATKPFGFTPYYPGPGIGGHCIPVDPFYLTWKAREYGLHTRFIELAGEINNAMPAYVVDKIAQGLNQARKPLNGSRVMVIGLAYKANVDDTRESPSVVVMDMLRTRGAEVAYHDPYVPRFPAKRDYHFELESVPLDVDTLQRTDAVVICTAHDAVDYDLILTHAPLVVDTRGLYRSRTPAPPNLVAA